MYAYVYAYVDAIDIALFPFHFSKNLLNYCLKYMKHRRCMTIIKVSILCCSIYPNITNEKTLHVKYMIVYDFISYTHTHSTHTFPAHSTQCNNSLLIVGTSVRISVKIPIW